LSNAHRHTVVMGNIKCKWIKYDPCLRDRDVIHQRSKVVGRTNGI
jgi:hypothetical protein